MKYFHFLLCVAAVSAHVIDIHIDDVDGSVTTVGGLPQVTATTMPAGCYWDGTAPFCAGACTNQFTCAQNTCGDGKCCITGGKSLCCSSKGDCPRALAAAAALDKGHFLNKDRFFKQDGDNDELCTKNEFICCAPGAVKNKQCSCIPNKRGPSDGDMRQNVLGGPPSGQLCKSKQTLCCNPDATTNDECACIDE